MAGERGVEDAFRVVEMNAAVDGDADFLTRRVKQPPDAAFVAEQVTETGVVGKICGFLRSTVGGEVGRRGADHPLHRRQLADDGILRRRAGQAQGEVDAVVDQVDDGVGQHQFAGHRRVAGNDFRQQGRDVEAAERDRGADAQDAVRRFAEVAHRQFGTADRLDGALRVLMEDFAGGRQAQVTCRTFEQAHAETAFKVGNLLADLGAGTVEMAGGGSHAAGFDHLDEGVPAVQPGHIVNDPLT